MNIQKKQQSGFTLIELMIVIAIVGILAAVALPAYQDYTIRAKMSEPLALLGEGKTSVSEYYITNGRLPVDEDAAGIRTNIDTDIVASLNYTNTGILTITLATGINANVDGQTFQLSLIDTSSGSPEWVCVPGTLEPKYLPANCRG